MPLEISQTPASPSLTPTSSPFVLFRAQTQTLSPRPLIDDDNNVEVGSRGFTPTTPALALVECSSLLKRKLVDMDERVSLGFDRSDSTLISRVSGAMFEIDVC